MRARSGLFLKSGIPLEEAGGAWVAQTGPPPLVRHLGGGPGISRGGDFWGNFGAFQKSVFWVLGAPPLPAPDGVVIFVSSVVRDPSPLGLKKPEPSRVQGRRVFLLYKANNAFEGFMRESSPSHDQHIRCPTRRHAIDWFHVLCGSGTGVG